MTQTSPASENKIQSNYTNLLFGDREDFSLEHRLFNSVCLFAFCAAFLGSITNIILHLDIILTLFTVFSAIVYSGLYYLSRKRNIFAPLVMPFIYYSFIILTTQWFLNAGSEGPVLFIYLVALVLFVIITEKLKRILVIISILINLLLLFYIEKEFPNYITGYENEHIKFYDISITFLFSFILIYFIVAILVRNYHEEKSISASQRDKLLNQQKQIIDSINYAKSLQTALLTEQNSIKKIIPDHFIFYKPKDIVSGDFYWAKKVNDYTVIAAADCTGHGVPGAFMSVLGISLLNEIIRRKNIKKASQTLEVLRYELKESLNQSKKDYSYYNGMDIALCVIDHDKKIIEYAGANAPLYMLRNNKLIEYKPTRNPIGLTPIEIPCQNNEIEYESDDIFYLFSDGFMDQFGGDEGKKFRSRRFKHMLLELHDKPFDIQKKIIELNLKKWMNNSFEQVDDIMIFGFKP